MAKVSELLNEAKKSMEGGKKPRKTKNSEQYYQMLIALCSDEDYVTKNVKEISNGEVVTEDMRLAPEFRKILVSALKKNTNMSEAEAIEAAKSFKLTTEQAKTLSNIVHECDYLIMKECSKKVQFIKKPGLDISLTIEEAPESIRPNPQDPTKKIKIKKHDRVKVQQSLHAFQKECM